MKGWIFLRAYPVQRMWAWECAQCGATGYSRPGEAPTRHGGCE